MRGCLLRAVYATDDKSIKARARKGSEVLTVCVEAPKGGRNDVAFISHVNFMKFSSGEEDID